jgi:hypothetical protein
MRIKTIFILFSLSLVIAFSLQAQTVTNAPSDLVNSNQNNFTPAEITEMQAKGIDPRYATIIQPITNREGHVILAQDVADLKSQGWTEEEIANAQIVQTNQITLSPTPPDLKNALVCIDNFLGGGKTGFPADVISIKKGALKFRFGGRDFDYSGNFSVLLTTPRQHKNPYFGFGKPETAKLLTLGDFFKGETDGTMILQSATIWEKSDGFIDAVAGDKEWILSGDYTITN